MNTIKRREWRLWALGIAAVAASACAPEGDGGEDVEEVASAVVVNTPFSPATHGFKFINSFQNDALLDILEYGGGLCGGMSYAALDYFFAKTLVPQQDYKPAVGTVLRDYLWNRQVKSLETQLPKWTELTVNPFGWRTSEFWGWGVQGFGGGRLQELRASIDAGKPVPIGLFGNGFGAGDCAGCTGHHQVIAIGYDLGRYKGDLGANVADLKIFVADPNFPGQTRTLRPDPVNFRYFYEESPATKWLTYLVDTGYVRTAAPNVPLAAREVLVTFQTGGDDLRGGNDNVDVVVLRQNGKELRFPNVNQSRRWTGDKENTVGLTLPADVPFGDVRGLRLETAFAGGCCGDNWNVDAVALETRNATGHVRVLRDSGTPLVRFTGALHTKTLVRKPGPGFMILSDVNSGLAVNAFSGAGEESLVKLSSNCSAANTDCTWSYKNGMILSDTDPSLALNAWGGAKDGTTLKLTRLCSAANPDCTWTYKDGEFLSDTNRALAITVSGNAQNGAQMVLAQACTATNKKCTWTLPHVMLSGGRRDTFGVRPVSAPANWVKLDLDSGCKVDTAACTWTFKRGMIWSDADSTLAVNAIGGAANGIPVGITSACDQANPDCRWVWTRGTLQSAVSSSLLVRAGDGDANEKLTISNSCKTDDASCQFTAFFGR